MLMHPTLDKLDQIPMRGMAKALREQIDQLNLYQSLAFEERLGLLVDREVLERDNRRLATRLRTAKFPMQACIEDLDFNTARSLDKPTTAILSTCDWVRNRANIIVTGPTGVGKTYLACAFAQKACREGFKARYLRITRLFQDLAIAKADGRYPKLMESYAKMDVLILDDWGMAPFTNDGRRDLLELFEDRYDKRSTIITSQFPTSEWHKLIGDPTLADAILDRFVHRSYHLKLKGESMRKTHSPLTNESASKS